MFISSDGELPVQFFGLLADREIDSRQNLIGSLS
jgi:hypothetical protein